MAQDLQRVNGIDGTIAGHVPLDAASHGGPGALREQEHQRHGDGADGTKNQVVYVFPHMGGP